MVNPEMIVKLAEVGGITKISTGFDHSLAVNSSGEVYAWGSGRNFKLGTEKNQLDQTIIERTPELVLGLSNSFITSIQACKHISLALDSQGKLFQWGKFSFQQSLNKKKSFATPLNLFPPSIYIISVSAGSENIMALDMYGKVYSWGKGDYGGLGTEST